MDHGAGSPWRSPTSTTAADLLNDRVVPFFDAQEVRLCWVLTDRGTECCGNPERHEYELYLARFMQQGALSVWKGCVIGYGASSRRA